MGSLSHTRGCFITLEGGEGVGKTTLAKSLKAEAELLNKQVLLTREPGGSQLAEHLRSVILNPPNNEEWSALGQTLLFYAAREDHLQKTILPALNKGFWVICDRFSDSTRAYQEVASGTDRTIIDMLDEIIVGSNKPDITFVLDIDFETAKNRRALRDGHLSETDVFEQKSRQFHDKVRLAFQNICDDYPKRCHLLDASQRVDTLTQKCMTILREKCLFDV